MIISQVIVTSSDGVKFAVNTCARSVEQMVYAAKAEQKFAGMNTAAQLMLHADYTLQSDFTNDEADKAIVQSIVEALKTPPGAVGVTAGTWSGGRANMQNLPRRPKLQLIHGGKQ